MGVERFLGLVPGLLTLFQPSHRAPHRDPPETSHLDRHLKKSNDQAHHLAVK